jgi:2',3'-cyclic-nucleotide 2'-phosphodiesterase (5'-nucleotidase family)
MRNTHQPMLLVDGGDFFGRDTSVAGASRLTWHNMENLKYDAVTVGETELAQLGLLQQMMEKTPLPLIATNVEVLQNGVFVPLGAPSHITTINGVKVGFLSLISESEASPAVLGPVATDIRILPPAETAARVAHELRKQVDLVVLLAHVDGKTMEEYASAMPDVDVVIGGHATIKDDGPIPIGRVVINRSGTRGQSVCSTRMIVSPAGKLVDFGGINVTLGPEFPVDSTVLAQVTQVKQDETQSRLAKNKLMQERLEQKTRERQEALPAANQAAPGQGQGAPGQTPVPQPPATPPVPPTPAEKP